MKIKGIESERLVYEVIARPITRLDRGPLAFPTPRELEFIRNLGSDRLILRAANFVYFPLSGQFQLSTGKKAFLQTQEIEVMNSLWVARGDMVPYDDLDKLIDPYSCRSLIRSMRGKLGDYGERNKSGLLDYNLLLSHGGNGYSLRILPIEENSLPQNNSNLFEGHKLPVLESSEEPKPHKKSSVHAGGLYIHESGLLTNVKTGRSVRLSERQVNLLQKLMNGNGKGVPMSDIGRLPLHYLRKKLGTIGAGEWIVTARNQGVTINYPGDGNT